MEKCNDLIRNWTHDLTASSIVPQSSMLSNAPKASAVTSFKALLGLKLSEHNALIHNKLFHTPNCTVRSTWKTTWKFQIILLLRKIAKIFRQSIKKIHTWNYIFRNVEDCNFHNLCMVLTLTYTFSFWKVTKIDWNLSVKDCIAVMLASSLV
jgi:hypothetical protein